MKKIITLSLLLSITVASFSQRGKDGDYTVSSSNEVLNAYTYLTTNENVGSTQIQVNSNTLNSGFFSSNLAAGDLLMIIQMQGATMFVDMTPATWGASNMWPNDPTFGNILNASDYNNSGKNELVEVESVSGGGIINLQCGLKNAYTAAGHVQVVRIPRFNNLTIDNTITAPNWDGNVGGIVAIETNGILNVNTADAINVDGKGFRSGKATDNVSANTSAGNSGKYGSSNNLEGGEKGEGVAGFYAEYDALNSRYARGAPANGGGGGNYHNTGGGGGANAGLGTYTAFGNPQPGFNNAWNQESPGFASSTSSGGGRGGYSHSNSNRNAATTGPNNSLWGDPDNRRNEGGLGGQPLDYSTGRLFFGGGGGSGEQNDGDAGDGGNGAGLIYITSYGSMTGTGTFNANGADGDDSGNGTFSSPGADGGGGAGAGGTIIINTNGDVPSTLTLNAQGGNGGNHILILTGGSNDNNANGPGGGGGGGYIAISSGSPTRNTDGGTAGTTNSAALTEFVYNGATNGGNGINNESIDFYAIDIRDTVVCGGGSVDLTVDLTGTLPGGSSVEWYSQEFGGASFNSGLTYTTPSLASNTTYYVGICPGNYRVPVVITISPDITLDETGLNISNVTCVGNDGAVTGIVASGGTGTLDFEWNGNASASEDLNNVAAADYTLVVTDDNGCTASSGPHTVGSSGGPVLDTTNFSIDLESCNGGDGAISGITATGTNLTFEWNGNSSATLDIANLPAGDYTLVVEDNNNCQVTSGVYTIGTTPDPIINTATATIDDANCGLTDGEITGVTVNGAGGYSYEWDGNPVGSIDISNLAPGDHELIVTDQNGCDDTTTVNVGEGLPPVLNIASMVITSTDCDTDNGAITGITATGNGPFTFNWNGVSQGTNSSLTGVGASDNTVIVFDAGNCSDTIENITVNTIVGPTIDATGIMITNTDCTTDNGSITGITATTGNGSISYEWNGNSNGVSADLTGLGVSTNTLVAIDDAGCTDTLANIPIVTNSGPTIDDAGLTITGDNCNLCDGTITGLSITGGTAPYVTTWSNGASQLDLSSLCADTYDLTVTDAAGCEAILNGSVVPSVGGIAVDDGALVSTNETCLGDDGSITGLVANGGTGALSYAWDNSSNTTIDINGLNEGDYTLTVSDGVGCQEVYGPISIGLDPGVTADFTFSPNPVSVDEMIQFSDNSSNTVINWDWDFDGQGVSSISDPQFSFNAEGSYVVELIVSDGNCSDTTTQTIDVVGELVVPNVITPNNDQVNDVFVIKGLKPGTLVSIRNRWGNVVFESSDYQNDWAGYDQSGGKLSPGNYFFVIEKNGELLKQGFVVLRTNK